MDRDRWVGCDCSSQRLPEVAAATASDFQSKRPAQVAETIDIRSRREKMEHGGRNSVIPRVVEGRYNERGCFRNVVANSSIESCCSDDVWIEPFRSGITFQENVAILKKLLIQPFGSVDMFRRCWR